MLRCVYIDEVHGVGFFDTVTGKFLKDDEGCQNWPRSIDLFVSFGDDDKLLKRLTELAREVGRG